jgi:hypothetical protein
MGLQLVLLGVFPLVEHKLVGCRSHGLLLSELQIEKERKRGCRKEASSDRTDITYAVVT